MQDSASFPELLAEGYTEMVMLDPKSLDGRKERRRQRKEKKAAQLKKRLDKAYVVQ